MNNPLIILSLLFLSITVSLAQENAKIKIDIQDGNNPWSNLKINNGQETFQFAIVTDRTGGHRPGVFMDGVNKLNLLQPEFVMSVGDLIEGYTEDTTRLNREWMEFNGFIKNLQMPFFYVAGNHDITNKVMLEKWKELFGRTYYHFIYKDVLFLCLNSEENHRGAGRGAIDNAQYKYFKKVLDENKDVRWTLLFMHQPLWDQMDTKKWQDVENLLEDRKHTVFVGHNHRYRKYQRNNGKYFILATTGGGSALRGPNFGEFDHVVWITMTDNGPIIANLLLEGIWDENVMTENLADFVFPISNHMPISLSPTYIDDVSFSNIKPVIKISNNKDIPMKVNMEILASKNMLVDPVFHNSVVNPNDVESIQMSVTSVGNKTLKEIDGLKLEMKISYEMENRPDIEFTETFNIKPALKYSIAPSKEKITIDGALDDWNTLPYELDNGSYIHASPFTHSGNTDASGKFSVTFDEDKLYIAADIIDDDIYCFNGKNPLYQDAVMVFIDARPADDCNRTTQNNLFTEWLLLAVSPTNEKSIYQKNRLPKGTHCRIVKTDKGYSMEASIPISYLEKYQQGEWKNIRINFMINDYDQGGNHVSRISWKPIWTEEENYLGSGTFFR